MHPLLQQEQGLFLEEIPGRNELNDGNCTGTYANEHLLSLLLASNKRVYKGAVEDAKEIFHKWIIGLKDPSGNCIVSGHFLQELQALIDEN